MTGLTRRTLLGAGAGAAFTAFAESTSAVAAEPTSATSTARTFLDRMMDAYPAHDALRLPQSYSDELGLYSTAACTTARWRSSRTSRTSALSPGGGPSCSATGTAQYAAALIRRGGPGNIRRAYRLLGSFARAQGELGAGQSVGGVPLPAGSGLVAASSPLHTGFFDSGYYQYRHVGATARYLLAALWANPYRL